MNDYQQAIGYDKEGHALYEVEAIRDKKYIDGEPFYFIKWVGWPDDDNTWEPIENLYDILNMVEEFNINYDKNTNNKEDKNKKESKPKKDLELEKKEKNKDHQNSDEIFLQNLEKVENKKKENLTIDKSKNLNPLASLINFKDEKKNGNSISVPKNIREKKESKLNKSQKTNGEKKQNSKVAQTLPQKEPPKTTNKKPPIAENKEKFVSEIILESKEKKTDFQKKTDFPPTQKKKEEQKNAESKEKEKEKEQLIKELSEKKTLSNSNKNAGNLKRKRLILENEEGFESSNKANIDDEKYDVLNGFKIGKKKKLNDNVESNLLINLPNKNTQNEDLFEIFDSIDNYGKKLKPEIFDAYDEDEKKDESKTKMQTMPIEENQKKLHINHEIEQDKIENKICDINLNNGKELISKFDSRINEEKNEKNFSLENDHKSKHTKHKKHEHYSKNHKSPHKRTHKSIEKNGAHESSSKEYLNKSHYMNGKKDEKKEKDYKLNHISVDKYKSVKEPMEKLEKYNSKTDFISKNKSQHPTLDKAKPLSNEIIIDENNHQNDIISKKTLNTKSNTQQSLDYYVKKSNNFQETPKKAQDVNSELEKKYQINENELFLSNGEVNFGACPLRRLNYGDFKKNKPKSIKKIVYKKKEDENNLSEFYQNVFILIEWENNETTKPKDTFFSGEEVLKNCPALLCNYFLTHNIFKEKITQGNGIKILSVNAT